MDLLDEIRARVSPQVRASHDSEAIAAAVSIGRVRPTSREIGNGLVLETLGIEAGNAVIDLAHNTEALRHVRPLLEQGRLVVSSNLVATWLNGLVAGGVLDEDQAAALTALGYEPAPVTDLEVREACLSRTGEWLL